MHDVAGIEVELQGLVQDEETDVLKGVREIRDENSCNIMGDMEMRELFLGATQILSLDL